MPQSPAQSNSFVGRTWPVVVLGGAVLVAVLGWRAVAFKTLVVPRYFTSEGEVLKGSPLFDEINAVLCPNYEVEAILARRPGRLREVNQLATPTLLLREGRLVTVNVPINLLVSCLQEAPPELLVFGSSRAREAIRPDVLARDLRGPLGPAPRVLNLSCSGGSFTTFRDMLATMPDSRPHLRAILICADDRMVPAGQTPHAREAASQFQASWRASGAVKFVAGAPTLQLLLDQRKLNVSREGVRALVFPPDLDARYADFHAAYLNNAQRGEWRAPAAHLRALAECLEVAKRRADTVIVTNSFATDAWIAVNAPWQRTYEVVREACERHGVVYLNLDRDACGFGNADFYFAKNVAQFDPVHLNPRAAVRYSELVSAKLRPLLAPDETMETP